MNFVVFRVVCAVMCLITNTFTLFVFLGWHARLFLITTTIASFVCFSGGVRGYFQTTTVASFVFRVACVLFQLLLLLRVLLLFFGWRARSFLNYYQYHEFCVFRLACAVIFLNITSITNFVFSGGVRG